MHKAYQCCDSSSLTLPEYTSYNMAMQPTGWQSAPVARAEDGNRPDYYKVIGVCLAICSGLFIGTSFVLKKAGLLKANEKYNEVAGEGYGYLKNAYWWGGMTLMIVGEVLNFIAYAFTDAILVTPLGALSVVITAVLSAVFLKERLSMVGKVACFLCIIGSVVIALNGPKESSVADIQQMQRMFITPGFLSYAGVVLVGSAVTAFYVGPRWGRKNMLVYISICSWIGGLSVVSTQGLGAAIIAWIGGDPQYKFWFLWFLFVFVIGTLLTEIVFLNVSPCQLKTCQTCPDRQNGKPEKKKKKNRKETKRVLTRCLLCRPGTESAQHLQRSPGHPHVLCLLH